MHHSVSHLKSTDSHAHEALSFEPWLTLVQHHDGLRSSRDVKRADSFEA